MSRHGQASFEQRKASDPKVSAWVNANAGSGKTHVLVDRVIRLILDGTEPSRILCLTFTKAAAAEMAARIFQRLATWVMATDAALIKELANLGVEETGDMPRAAARRLFAATQETPGGLKIQTIHAFCERLLQLFPVEAGIVPGFGVLDEREAKELLTASRDAVLVRGAREAQSALGKAIARATSLTSPDQFDALLHEMLASSENWYEPGDPEAAIANITAALSIHLDVESHAAFGARLAIDRQKYLALAAMLAGGGKKATAFATQTGVILCDPDATLADFAELYLRKSGDARTLGGLVTSKLEHRSEEVMSFLASEQIRLVEGLGQLDDLERIAATEAMLTIAAAVLREYEARKRQCAFYDFNDLIARTRALLAEKPDAAWVLYKLDGGIDHVLVDEAQDTSPGQWDIIESLTSEFFAGTGARPDVLRTVFAVGDRKQSIYSFQGADPNVFETVRESFKERVEGAGLQFRDVDFRVSFRSAPEVLQAVDAVFREGAPARRGLDGRLPSDILHQPTREEHHGIVEVWPLVEPDEKDEPDPWTAPVDQEPANAPPRKLARSITKTLKEWIGKRHIGSTGRVVAPGDILVLVRQRKSFFDALISELRQAGIPVAGADRLKLRESLAVLDLVALGTFASLPVDDFSLACLLKSPLVSTPLSEEELFGLCYGRASQSLWNRLRHDARFAGLAAELQLWRERAAELPPFEFFASVLQQRRRAIVERLGPEANDALDAFLQAALDHGTDRSPSLASFLAWFNAGDIEIKRNMEQGRGEVRVMTVHGAKGLEAPIVILPDTTGIPENTSRPTVFKIPTGSGRRVLPLWSVSKLRFSARSTALKEQAKDEDFEEFHRLLYVAMTRAKDELYVCGYRNKKEPKDGNWHQRVSAALESLEETRRLESGALRLGIDPQSSLAVSESKAKTVSVPSWFNEPVPPETHAAARSITGLAREDQEPPPQATAARSRGLLVHRLLEVLPDTPAEERAGLARRMVARAGEPESLADQVLSLLARPELKPFFDAEGLPEVALSAPLPEFNLKVTGRIDRLVVTGDTIAIIDYKTDRNFAESLNQVPAAYARQMALYRKVMENAYPDRAVTCLLVWTAGPSVMELPSSFLDQALAKGMAAVT